MGIQYIYYLVNFLLSLLFILPIWTFFFVGYHHFDFYIASFLIVITGFISSILEIPSGIIADKFGRKKVFTFGLILELIGFFIWLIAHSLIVFLLSSILIGIGRALKSGNLEALIHDYLAERGKEEKFKYIVSNGYFFIFLGKVISGIFAGYLYELNVFYPIYALLIVHFLALILILFLPDSHQIEKSNKILAPKIFLDHFVNAIKAIKLEIWILLGFIVIVSIIGNIYYFTYQYYLDFVGFRIKDIGIIFAIGGIFSMFGTQVVKKLMNKFESKPDKILQIMWGLTFLAALLFGLFNRTGALLGVIISSFVAGFIGPFGTQLLLKNINEKYKSTVLSIFNFLINISYSIFVILVAYLIDVFGIVEVYIGLILFSLIFLILVVKYKRFLKIL